MGLSSVGSTLSLPPIMAQSAAEGRGRLKVGTRMSHERSPCDRGPNYRPHQRVEETTGEPQGESQRGGRAGGGARSGRRSEEHTSELQSLMRISYAVFCLKKNK